jgi:hypothetical protein
MIAGADMIGAEAGAEQDDRLFFYSGACGSPGAWRRAGEVGLGPKRILARVPIVPTNPSVTGLNSRGSTRGGRGIPVTEDHVYVASYHSILVFDHELTLESACLLIRGPGLRFSTRSTTSHH